MAKRARALRTAVIFHEPSLPYKSIVQRWTESRGHPAPDVYRVSNETPRLPDPKKYDLIVGFGAAPSVYDHAEHPWIKDERRVLSNAIDQGKAVVGICFTAQQLAFQLGGGVEHKNPSIRGLYPIHLTEEGRKSSVFPKNPSQLNAIHSFEWALRESPGSAVTLRGEHGPIAFEMHGGRVVGILVHLEAHESEMEAKRKQHEKFVQTGLFTQEQMDATRQGVIKHGQENNEYFMKLLDNIVTRHVHPRQR